MSNLHLYTDEQLLQTGKRLKFLLKEAISSGEVETLEEVNVFINAQITLEEIRKEYKKRLANMNKIVLPL